MTSWPAWLARAARVPALRGLAFFWGGALAVLLGGALVLEVMGPPAPGQPAPTQPAPTHPAPARIARAALATEMPPSQALPVRPPPLSPRPPGAAIPPPRAELLEPAPDLPGALLPRIGEDGELPRQAYAGGFDPKDTRPRVALVLAGFGLSQAESEEVLHAPAGLTLAMSAYAVEPERLATEARVLGHELLASIPMEPEGYPLNDEGPQELLRGASPAENQRHLRRVLSRFEGYAGATGASDGLRGERYAGAPDLFARLQADLAARGLYYLDPRPGQPAPARVPGRAVDIVVDEPAVRSEIDARLARLEQIARDTGSAIGLAGAPHPVTVDRIVAWARTLESRGLVLVPVSALIRLPASPDKPGE